MMCDKEIWFWFDTSSESAVRNMFNTEAQLLSTLTRHLWCSQPSSSSSSSQMLKVRSSLIPVSAVQMIHLSFWFTLIFRRRWKRRGCPLRYTHTDTHTHTQLLSISTRHLWCSQPSSSSSSSQMLKVRLSLISVSSFWALRLLFAEVETLGLIYQSNVVMSADPAHMPKRK